MAHTASFAASGGIPAVMLAVEIQDTALIRNTIGLERKLSDFQSYYNLHRTHSSLGGNTPAEAAGGASKLPIKLGNFHWQTHCKGLYQLPIAA